MPLSTHGRARYKSNWMLSLDVIILVQKEPSKLIDVEKKKNLIKLVEKAHEKKIIGVTNKQKKKALKPINLQNKLPSISIYVRRLAAFNDCSFYLQPHHHLPLVDFFVIMPEI